MLLFFIFLSIVIFTPYASSINVIINISLHSLISFLSFSSPDYHRNGSLPSCSSSFCDYSLSAQSCTVISSTFLLPFSSSLLTSPITSHSFHFLFALFTYRHLVRFPTFLSLFVFSFFYSISNGTTFVTSLLNTFFFPVHTSTVLPCLVSRYCHHSS